MKPITEVMFCVYGSVSAPSVRLGTNGRESCPTIPVGSSFEGTEAVWPGRVGTGPCPRRMGTRVHHTERIADQHELVGVVSTGGKEEVRRGHDTVRKVSGVADAQVVLSSASSEEETSASAMTIDFSTDGAGHDIAQASDAVRDHLIMGLIHMASIVTKYPDALHTSSTSTT